MISLVKQIIACLLIATLVTVACYFLPVVNGLFGDYIIGFFLAAFVLPVWMRLYICRATENSKKKRGGKKTCNYQQGWSGMYSGITTGVDTYDKRNIDQQIHVLDGLKEDSD